MKPREILSLIAHLQAQERLLKGALNESLAEYRNNPPDEDRKHHAGSILHKLSEVQRRLGLAEVAYRKTTHDLCAK